MEEQEHITELLSIKRSRLQVLEKQAAYHGIDSPAHILMEIAELRHDAEEIDRKLRNVMKVSPVSQPSDTVNYQASKNMHPRLVPVYEITFLSGSRVGQKVPLTNMRLLVGRLPDSDIVVDESEFSRAHFALQWDSLHTTFRIVSFGATQPIVINGHILTREQALQDGDIISVGATKMHFHKTKVS
jgi:hypothetical protein